jgi:hypothetical protein
MEVFVFYAAITYNQYTSKAWFQEPSSLENKMHAFMVVTE